MEAPPAASAVARNGGFSMPQMSASSSQSSRKEWRVVSEQSARNPANEELDRSKLGQSDERLIYEVQRGSEPLDVDFCSITADGGLDNDILQQRLRTVGKQREELLHLEIELRAQVIARSEIVGMQNNFAAQIKECSDANAKLEEQLHEKEQKIHELERKMGENERELHTIRLDNEAAWAKEDLIREQSKELQSYRRERDNAEAERLQHIKQIHDLQEHIQGKDRQFMELQEQHRIAQETIVFKDEQLREAQAWISRAQEMDAFQSTTNHTLQAELRERMEHYNQLWVGCQRQFGEIERLHLHIQQLQLELADAREKSGSKLDGSQVSQINLKDASELGQSNGSQLDVNGNGSLSANSGSPQNANSENASGENTSTQADHIHGVAFAPPSLLGMPAYVPTGQVTALHPFVMHEQGHPSHIMQSHFNSASAVPSIQNWQNQEAKAEGQHVPTHNQYPQQAAENMLRTDSHYYLETSGNEQILRSNYVDISISRGLGADSAVPSQNGEGLSLQQISSQFHDALGLNPLERGKGSGAKEKHVNHVSEHGMENKMGHSNLTVNATSSEALANPKSFTETSTDTASSADSADGFVSTGQQNDIVGKLGESYLLDERALLASIARTIGSSGRIRISSTLHNRLGKILAPLHWHDYRKKYGKLDDFLANHPELFFIEADYIQLHEGAQEIIAATAAVAKVAAAAAAVPSSYSPMIPSVAVTPLAQSNRPKKPSSLEFVAGRPLNTVDHRSAVHHQSRNGGSFRVAGGTSNVKILSKVKDHVELNGSDNPAFSQNKDVSPGRSGVSSVGRQPNRAIGEASSLRR